MAGGNEPAMSQRPLLVTSLVLTAVALLGAGTLFGRSTAERAGPPEAPPVGRPAPEPEPATTAVADRPEEPIGPSAAAATALAAVPGARLLGTPELVSFRGQPAYEANLDRGTVYVDAHSRRVLYDGTRPPTPAPKAGHEDEGQLAHADGRRRHHHEHEEDGDEDD